MFKIFVFIISLLTIFPTLSFAESYSCQRLRLDHSGFTTKAAAASWYNKNINITTDITAKTAYYKGGNTVLVVRDDNKRMKAVFKRKASNGKRLDFTFIFLPNGEVHADLKTGGGYKSAGGAVYKCSNWYKGKIISASEPNTKSIISKRNSNTDISNYSDYLICLEAVSKTGGWEIRDTVIHYVKEAERRGLTCGVSSPASSMSASSYSTYSDEAICNLATDKGYKTSWRTSNYGKEFVNQAKRRGLTCGIVDIEKEKQAELEREQRLKVEQEKIKKKAAEVARMKRLKEEKQKKKKLVQEKAKRDAQIKVQKLAKEKAKLKAQKLAEEKAEIKNDTLEHVNMIQDIEVFSSKQNIFDPIKIGTLFVKLDNSKKNKWTINSSKVYRELKKYVFSFNEFKDFREQRKQNRLNIENESLDILSKSLNSKISLLKEYISKNLRSKNIPIVIELISKIEKELAKKNVKSLKILNQKVQEWISKNIKNSKTKNKTIKTEDTQTIPLSKDNSIRFDLLSLAIISKEFGDGFSNYEANKNNYLCGLILKINNVSKNSYNTKDLNFRVTFDSNRVVQEAKDVSRAFALQEGLDNVGGTTLKAGANYSTGIGFILPSTELDTKYILLEVFKNKKIIFQQKILSTKN